MTAPKKKKRKKRVSAKWLFIKNCILVLLTLTIFLICFIGSVYIGAWGEIPSPSELKQIHKAEASRLYTESGVLLGKYYIENRTNIDFKNLPTNAINALIATEDIRYYQHHGLDRISLLRVFFKTLIFRQQNSGGGSTISQQLAKNLYPREEQPTDFLPIIKLKEIFIAQRLEKIYTKEEILTLYLNTVSFGENTFGLESASQKFFSKPAAKLNLPEAATLIGMLKAPSYYNPHRHPQRAIERRNVVINQMEKYSFITAQQSAKLKKTELNLHYKEDNHFSGSAPYLREKIRQDAIEIIRKYNHKNNTNYNLYQDGLILTTTIDAELQKYAEAAVAEHMKDLQKSFVRHINSNEPWKHDPKILINAIHNSDIYQKLKSKGMKEKAILEQMKKKKHMTLYSPGNPKAEIYCSSIDSIKHYLTILHAGLIAIEPQSGKIKAWVGDINYKYFQFDQITAKRQVGSIFKPIVYSAAINQGARLDAYYSNNLKSYKDYDNWTPRNANNDYNGYYTIKGALCHSINTIAVKVLLQTGIEEVIDHAHQLGIIEDLPPYPSLALGVANIPLQQMTNPFMAFANDGILHSQYYLKKITTKEGKIIFEENPSKGNKVLTTNNARILNQILSSAIDEGTGKRLRSSYGLTNKIAGKTGTTQNQADGWFIGYTPHLVVGIRVGANDTKIHFNSLSLGQGANMALPIYGKFLKSCSNSHNFRFWDHTSFPLPANDSILNLPAYKEKLNLQEKISNHKIKKTLDDEVEKGKQRTPHKGFFNRIFKRKKHQE